MRIIKPYGRSHVEDGGRGKRRVLRLNRDPATPRDIADFAATHDALVIAQWISVIDKIATKPKQDNKPTEAQFTLRRKLGEAAWTIITEKGLLGGADGTAQDSKAPSLHDLWQSKIAPYGDARKKDDKKISPRGRWYGRFIGDGGVDDIDDDAARAVAEKIYRYLYTHEYAINAVRRNSRNSCNKSKGLIRARAESIAENVLRPVAVLKTDKATDAWTKKDEEAYCGSFDVAKKIYTDAKKAGNGRVFPDCAAKVLYVHYGRLFTDDAGKVLSIADARCKHPGLFALHMAVKDVYTRTLKKNKKKNISRILPKDAPALFNLVGKGRVNRDLNALVRLGKVIHYRHYEKADDEKEDGEKGDAAFKADIENSVYWTSDGQAEIKRNEAFVRVWRRVLALAGVTLKNWADPRDCIKTDILMAQGINQAVGKKIFRLEDYRKKLPLLFGASADLFDASPEGGGENADTFPKDLLRFALKKTADLRNGTFHFRGRSAFSEVMTGLAQETEDAKSNGSVFSAVHQLWEGDWSGWRARVCDTFRAAHFATYFDEEQNRRLFNAIAAGDVGAVPLPRLRRVLARAQDDWKGKNLAFAFPKPANRSTLEGSPGLLCCHTALKRLFDRPFRAWLEMRPTSDINAYIDTAVARASEAAQKIHKKSGRPENMIAAKAAGLPKLAEGQNIADFFSALSAATATEMRVQRGYDSDPEQARAQAEYIEKLKCNVVLLAFADFLQKEGFGFLATPPQKGGRGECDLDRICTVDPPPADDVGDWRKVLYFLLHLVPVDEVGLLLHQIRKWQVLSTKTAPSAKNGNDGDEGKTREMSRRLCAVLTLYLDMHDAKFSGENLPLAGSALKDLFENAKVFEKVFPAGGTDDDARHLPRRGLREILRFGHLPVLTPFFKARKITAQDVEAWEGARRAKNGQSEGAHRAKNGQSEIAVAQENREELHQKWMMSKKRFTDADADAYACALRTVAHHRHMAAHVTLTNHVRLHRLMMMVLGRLVDFSGLWERDLYFVALALAYRHGGTLDDFLKEKLSRGQIVRALCPKNRKDRDHPLWTEVDAVFPFSGGLKKIRNDFAHFNMLRDNENALNLTRCANEARRLMAYDRKLKNAVSKSIIELLAREGLILRWKMGTDHLLAEPKISSRRAVHLGGKKFPSQGKGTGKGKQIKENLHDERYVEMVSALFGVDKSSRGGESEYAQKSVKKG